MSEARRKYTREFKTETIRYLESSGKSAREIEEDMGIGKGVIYRWKRELSEDKILAFPVYGNPRDEELARLRKENAILREERDILRKAVAIFSRPKK